MKIEILDRSEEWLSGPPQSRRSLLVRVSQFAAGAAAVLAGVGFGDAAQAACTCNCGACPFCASCGTCPGCTSCCAGCKPAGCSYVNNCGGSTPPSYSWVCCYSGCLSIAYDYYCGGCASGSCACGCFEHTVSCFPGCVPC